MKRYILYAVLATSSLIAMKQGPMTPTDATATTYPLSRILIQPFYASVPFYPYISATNSYFTQPQTQQPQSTKTSLYSTQQIKSSALTRMLSDEINAKYSNPNPIINCFTVAPAYDLVSFIQEKCAESEISPKTLEWLYKKNNHFKTAIDHITEVVQDSYKGHNSFNGYSLLAIEKPSLASFSSHENLKQLSLPFLTYIIKKAFFEIKDSYTIPLETHSDSISCFDICSQAHLAITASPQSGICIWDLKKAELMHAIMSDPIFAICFRPDGSHFATLTRQKNKAIIKELRTDTGQCTCTFKAPMATRIAYLCYSSEPILQTSTLQLLRVIQTLWKISENRAQRLDSSEMELSTYHSVSITNPNSITYRNDVYKAYINILNWTSLVVEKQNCQSLYLCEMAIENSNVECILMKIKTSHAYSDLTEYERCIIDKKIKEKLKQIN